VLHESSERPDKVSRRDASGPDPSRALSRAGRWGPNRVVPAPDRVWWRADHRGRTASAAPV